MTGDAADWDQTPAPAPMMLRTRKPQLARARLIDALVAQLGSSPQELDLPVSFLFNEIGRRRRIAGCGYPLIVDGTVIKRYEPPVTPAEIAADLENYL